MIQSLVQCGDVTGYSPESTALLIKFTLAKSQTSLKV